MQTLLTAKEVAPRLGLTAKTLREWARDGKIPYVNLPGNNIRFDEAVIESFIEKRTVRTRHYSSQKQHAI